MEIQYFPTLKCNFDCDYCVSHNKIEFSLDENRRTLFNIFRLFREKQQNGCLYIVGGEPSLHRNFLDIMHYINILKKTIFPANIELQTNLGFKE